MLARLRIVLIALLLAATAHGAVKITARYEKSERGTFQGLPVLILRGTPAERGEAHGYLCARDILMGLDSYVLPTARLMAGAKGAALSQLEVEARRFCNRFYWPEPFREELDSTLAGIRKALPKAADRTLARTGEEVTRDDLVVAATLADWGGMGCSSFSVWGGLTEGGQTVTGRNLDYGFNNAILRSQCIMVIVPDEPDRRATMGFTFFGLMGALTAMNSEGVFCAMHDCAGLPRSKPAGWTPRCIALRDALEQASAGNAVADMAKVLRSHATYGGNNVHVSVPRTPDASPAAVLEWDGNSRDGGVTVRAPARGEDFLCNTNHYRLRRTQNGGDRYRRLRAALEKAALSGTPLDKPESFIALVRAPAVGGTALSVVAWPERRAFSAAFGRKAGRCAADEEWISFTWDDIAPNQP